MKYVMSWTDVHTFHHDLRFIPLHYTRTLHIVTTVYFPSLPFPSPHFTSLHFISLHFTSLHYILMTALTTSLRLIYHFVTLFLKLLDLHCIIISMCFRVSSHLSVPSKRLSSHRLLGRATFLLEATEIHCTYNFHVTSTSPWPCGRTMMWNWLYLIELKVPSHCKVESF
jgi:hypothetical protein